MKATLFAVVVALSILGWAVANLLQSGLDSVQTHNYSVRSAIISASK
jgi:hypothetical protein